MTNIGFIVFDETVSYVLSVVFPICAQIATQNNWDHLCASSFVLKQDSPGALLQALDADFGSASDHSQMKSDNMRLGKWGLAKFIDALLIPFLDHYETDDDSYYAIFSILQTFCREASKYIESCRKSVRVFMCIFCLLQVLC